MSTEKDRNEIVERVASWEGEVKAMKWYQSQPISEFDGLTAEEMVEKGCVDIVRAYLDHVEMGGYT